MKSKLHESMADLDLDDVDDARSPENAKISDPGHVSKRDIALHPDLPKEKFRRKEAPTLLKEVQYVGNPGGDDQARPESRVAGRVDESTYQMFEDRAEELESLRRIVRVLKDFIKRYRKPIIAL